MKLLIKGQGNNLVWQDAIYKDRRFLSLEGTEYNFNDIYTVKDDNRNRIVVCSSCGAEIPNTPSAIRAHRNMVHKSNKCFDCRYLKHSDESVLSQKYVLNEDGTYTESTKRNVRLLCRIGWNCHDINSAKAKERCKYAGCENATFTHIEDFWTQYPSAFDEFVTIDKIIDIGYKNMYKYSDCIKYELNSTPNLYAYVNNQGICYMFALRHRHRVYTLRYSKKYNKIWANEYGKPVEFSHLDIAESTQNKILKKLKALYE